VGGVAPRECSVHVGSGHVLVVAPHGGLRAIAAPHQRTNDLHSGDLAEAIADALDASWLVNHGLDRNVLDLNRVSEVRDRAPWFAECLGEALQRILSRHEVACVVFVHGWHVMQPRCDIGVGARLDGPAEADAKAELLTASPSWLREHVEPLRSACSALGIRATYGERWPGAHPNNLLQAFRRKPRRSQGGVLAGLARHAASGRVEAMQLELGAPLRWPGRLRDEFVGICARALGARSPAPELPLEVETVPPPRPSPHRTAASRAALQIHDPRAGTHGIGIIAGIAHLPDGATGARLVLFPGGSRMAIFVGHARGHGPLAVDGLRIEPRPDGGLELSFEGHALLAEDAASYFRDERAQAAAQLVAVAATLSYQPIEASGYGRVDGRVALAGRSLGVERGRLHDAVPRTVAVGVALAHPCPGVVRRSRRHRRGHGRRGPPPRGRRLRVARARGAARRARPREWRLRARICGGGAPRVSSAEPGPGLAIAPRRRSGAGDLRVARFRWSRGGEGSGFYERVESDGSPG
jgi:hypothetical protein